MNEASRSHCATHSLSNANSPKRVIAVSFKTMSRFCSARVLLLLFFPLTLISCGGSNSSQSNSLDDSAENSFESTSSTAPQKTCAQGGVCAVEDVGPGGGIVFYDAGKEEPWGRYLEYACSGWQQSCDGSPDPEVLFGCGNSYPELDETIGLGKPNTERLVEKCGAESAAGVALAHVSPNGLDDWFLPSQWELEELHKYLDRYVFPAKSFDPDQVEEAGFGSDSYSSEYWSSTSKTDEGSVYLSFPDGGAGITFGPRPGRFEDNYVYTQALVRPIRAF